MCHISANTMNLKVAARNGGSDVTGTASGTVLTVNPRQHSKSTFRFSPFRKVAKSARINLNRYWGLLSQTSMAKGPAGPDHSPVVDHSYEEEQNRINEMLEAQNAAAVSDNARNFLFENSPDFRDRHHYFSSSASSIATSSRRSINTESDAMSIMSEGSYM